MLNSYELDFTVAFVQASKSVVFHATAANRHPQQQLQKQEGDAHCAAAENIGRLVLRVPSAWNQDAVSMAS